MIFFFTMAPQLRHHQSRLSARLKAGEAAGTCQWAKHLATLQWAKHFAITGLSDVAQDQAQLAQLAQLPVDSRTKTNDEIKEMVRTIGTRRKG